MLPPAPPDAPADAAPSSPLGYQSLLTNDVPLSRGSVLGIGRCALWSNSHLYGTHRQAGNTSCQRLWALAATASQGRKPATAQKPPISLKICARTAAVAELAHAPREKVPFALDPDAPALLQVEVRRAARVERLLEDLRERVGDVDAAGDGVALHAGGGVDLRGRRCAPEARVGRRVRRVTSAARAGTQGCVQGVQLRSWVCEHPLLPVSWDAPCLRTAMGATETERGIEGGASQTLSKTQSEMATLATSGADARSANERHF